MKVRKRPFYMRIISSCFEFYAQYRRSAFHHTAGFHQNKTMCAFMPGFNPATSLVSNFTRQTRSPLGCHGKKLYTHPTNIKYRQFYCRIYGCNVATILVLFIWLCGSLYGLCLFVYFLRIDWFLSNSTDLSDFASRRSPCWSYRSLLS